MSRFQTASVAMMGTAESGYEINFRPYVEVIVDDRSHPNG
jgi:hypothetical protein